MSIESVNIFDIIVVSVVLILGIKGALNGLIKEVFVLLGLIGGVFIASRVAPMAGEMINQNLLHLQNKSSLTLVGFVAVLVGVWLLSLLLATLFKKMVSLSGLGFLDMLFGFVVGSAKIFFIVSIIIYAISTIDLARKNLSKYLDDSFMYPIMVELGSYIIKLDTSEITDSINEKLSSDTPLIELQNTKEETNLTSTDTQ
jgi:membrane protein required for colicin V production